MCVANRSEIIKFHGYDIFLVWAKTDTVCGV
jgi:hypothetical protein